MTRIILLIATVLLGGATLVAQEPSPYAQAVAALAEGRYDEVESWYHGLSRRDRNSASALRLATLSAINSYKMELADERMEAYHKLRLRGESDQSDRAMVEAHLEKVARMLSNTRQVVTNDTLVASDEEVMARLAQQTAYLGVVQRNSYTSPDGKTKWQVELSSDSVPLFRVYHQLGNGQWDQQNPEEVEVLGLPERAEISFPFLKGDGSTLYFSIQQPGMVPEQTLGKRDIYVSRYNRSERQLLVPTQLSLPFNSAADDFAYIVDDESDLGWMVTDRATQRGELRLYTFTPSSLARYEGEELATVAKWSAPTIVHREVRSRGVRKMTEEPAYFWIGEQPIRSADDLNNLSAKRLFDEYLRVHGAYVASIDALTGLRQRLQRDPSLQHNSSFRSQVLGQEEQLELYRQRQEALRNEVIKSSGMAMN